MIVGHSLPEEDVTRFLREQALQDHEKNLSRTMVLVDDGGNPGASSAITRSSWHR